MSTQFLKIDPSIASAVFVGVLFFIEFCACHGLEEEEMVSSGGDPSWFADQESC